MVDYVTNIKDAVNSDSRIISTPEDLSGTYLFFSLDLVNSTFYKSKVETWADIFSVFFKFCKTKVNECFPTAQLWKMVGDEILFYMPISDLVDLYKSPRLIYDLMNKSVSMINEKETLSIGVLSVKATMWAACLADIEANKKVIKHNIIIKERVIDNINLDFLGPDIDIGFRISKFALQKKLVIDSKLACLLTKLETDLKENNISESMRIVSYERLKGVWEDRHYPIVWYQESWDSINNMFLYDEQFNSDIVKRIVESDLKSLQPVSFLTKIFTDLNKLGQIEELRKGIKEFHQNNPTGFKAKKIPFDKLCELHLVAICVNERNEILISKRTRKDDLPETWEFGCAQLHLKQRFKDAIQECYRNDFKIELTFFEEDPVPIGHYFLTKTKEDDRLVPGLIFVAKVDSGQLNNDKIDSTSHSETRWITAETSKNIAPDECVSKFHQRIIDAYAYIEEKRKHNNRVQLTA